MDESFERRRNHNRLRRPRRPVGHVLRHLVGLLSVVALSAPLIGCQAGYLIKSAYSQADLLLSRVPLDEALNDGTLSAEQKRKLRLARSARVFAESNLGLKRTKNYTSYVQLERPYVTYVVSAAPKNKLEHYDWKYPFLGKMPYKGFFHPEGAQEEAQRLRKKNLDVFVRGVSAYSTLGWFRDPILSSMLAYKDYDLVNTIIHETVHATIYIKGEADFNESLATFIGNKGTEEFYRALEGPDSSTVLAMQNDLEDERLFSDFISREMKDLKTWYERNADTLLTDEVRQARFKRIQARFKEEIRPKLRLKDSYKGFETAEINNARLLAYKMYIGDLAQFEAVFQKLDRDFARMMAFCKSLESSRDPKQDLLRAALAKP